jgi:hypothetical protein
MEKAKREKKLSSFGMIQIFADKPYYYGGELLRAHVALGIERATALSRIMLEFGRREVVYHETYDLFKADEFVPMISRPLWSSLMPCGTALQPNTYQYNVEIPLPNRMDSSLTFQEFSNASLRYEIIVYLVNTSGRQIAIQGGTLIIPILNNEPPRMASSAVNFAANRNKPMLKYNISWNLRDNEFDIKDIIELQLNLENTSSDSKDEITKVQVFLKERHAVGANQLEKIFTSSMRTISCKGFGKHQTRHFAFRLKHCRLNVQPSARGKILCCEHSICVMVNRKGLFRSPVQYEIPLCLVKMKRDELPPYAP